MISLVSRGTAISVESTLVGVVRWHTPDRVLALYDSAELMGDPSRLPRAIIHTRHAEVPEVWSDKVHPRVLVSAIQPLNTGDIVAVHPSGRVDTLFRRESAHNALFITEQCNSRCLMCSQPPRPIDDLEHFLTLNVRALRLMPRTTEVLGITGGEPTLLGMRLAELLEVCRAELPIAQVDVLSNGRLLADNKLVSRLASVADERMLFTIPLYADNPLRHDYIVQAAGAFGETVAGFYNLARVGIRSEVRVVLHRESARRLPGLAKFVQKNLPFVEQVAFMGLEMTGLARANEELLWTEPSDYVSKLQDALEYLADFGIASSIYNTPRCLVPPSLWPYLRLSISDWKREYVPACNACTEREACGGVFGTSSRLSAFIQAL